MNPEDLLKMLDLGGREARPPDGIPILSIQEPLAPVVGNPTALAVDEWGLRRGRDLVAESERLRSFGTDVLAAADFFTAAFDPDPTLNESCAEPRRHQFLTQLLDTPEYRALHAETRLDDTASAIAAGHFAEQFARLKSDESGEHSEGSATTEPASESKGDDLAREMSALRAVGKAVAEATKEIGELRETATALGMGPGEPGCNNPRAIAELFKRVRNDPALRTICDLAGRFRRVAQSRQRQKTAHGLDDVVGVEPGGDIGRLLPSELVKLSVPELELDTLRRIVERQTLCREHHAIEPVGLGPILVVVDESGSMEGSKAHTAKGLALALAWIARRQRRWAGLIAYSGGSGERLLALTPGRWDEDRLAEWLSAFIGCGSDLDVPIRELPRMVQEIGAPVGTTDVILVTDAQCRIPLELQQPFLTWKAATRVRVIAIVIESPSGDLVTVCDEVHIVPSLDPGGEAVGRVLSV